MFASEVGRNIFDGIIIGVRNLINTLSNRSILKESILIINGIYRYGTAYGYMTKTEAESFMMIFVIDNLSKRFIGTAISYPTKVWNTLMDDPRSINAPARYR